MTLSTTTVRATVQGSGITGPFSFLFRVFAATDLLVQKTSALGVVTQVNYPTDYTVTGVGNASGGTLTLSVALAVGESLSILRAVPNTQPTSFRSLGTFFPASHEDEFDRVTMLVQQNTDAIKRSARVVSSVDPATLTMELTPATGKVLGWASSTQLTNLSLDSSAVAIPGQSRTVATLSAYLANNAVFNVLDYGADSSAASDSAAAFNAAIIAARVVGGTVLVPNGRYLWNSPINLTFSSTDTAATKRPIRIVSATSTGVGPTSDTSSASIIVNHTGHAIDCAGGYDLIFENLNIGTASGVTAKTCFFLARNSANSSAGSHIFKHCRAYGSFANGVVYSYGSETNEYYDCKFYNTATNPVIYKSTAGNIDSLSSSLITIATGTQSNIVSTWFGGELQAKGANGKIFYLDRHDSMSVVGPWCFAADEAGSNGHSIVYVDQSVGTSNRVVLEKITGEFAAFLPQYGVYFTNHAQTPTHWTIRDCKFPTTTMGIFADVNTTMDNLRVEQLLEAGASHGITINGTLQNSTINTQTPLIVGTSKQNLLIGQSVNFTITTRNADVWIDLLGGTISLFGGATLGGTLVSPHWTSAAISVANNAQAVLCPRTFSGFAFIVDQTDVIPGQFAFCGTRDTAFVVSDPLTGNFSATLGSAGKTNVGSTGGNYVLENKVGATKSYYVQLVGSP